MRTKKCAFLLVVAAALLFLGGCDDGSNEQDGQKVPDLPPAEINLPAVPADLGQSKYLLRHPDGSLTVHGIKRDRLAWLEKEVTVKAQIVWVYDCPYDDKKPKTRRRKKDSEEVDEGPRCQRAHFYVGDREGQPKERLLVVGLTSELEESFEKEDLKVGDEHTIKGSFVEIGDGFVASDEGLLMLGTIAGYEPKEK
jgi:hypothetical protein